MSFPVSAPATMSRSALWGAIVVALALVVYGNTLGNGFVWDDVPIIVQNPQNRDPGALTQILSGIDSSRVSSKTPYYRPLTRLSYWVEYQVHGLNPALCHLANLVLHAVNAFLVYRLALLLFSVELPAAFAALLFAVHPANAEAVNFLATRNTLLSTFFVLAACLCFIRGLDGARPVRTAVLTGAFFLAGIFCKETGLFVLPLFPVLALTLSSAPARQSLSRSLPVLGACALAAVGYLAIRQQILSAAGVGIEILPGLGERLVEMLYLIPCSFLPLVWPVTLRPYYPLPEALGPLIPWLAFAWAGIVALVVWVLRSVRCSATLIGLSWYLLFYLPVSGIIPIPSAPMAERYLYLPAIGLWLIAAELLRRATLRFPERKSVILTAALCLLLALGLRTGLRNLDWKSDVTLFSRLAQDAPKLAFAHHNLGTAYLDQAKDPLRAQAELEKTLALDPRYPRTHTVLGYLQMQRQNLPAADLHLSQALAQDPDDAEAHYNRAVVLEQLGRQAEAIPHLVKFLALDNPEFAGARPEAEAKLKLLQSRR